MTDNKNEEFPIVDEMGNILGAITRGHAHDGSKILHPVVHLHVFNSKGDLYLQHRPAWKDIQPDKWDTACGGHVDLGESVNQALHREVREELGITDFEPESLGHYVFESQREKELVYVHRCVYDGEVKPSQEELAGGRLIPMAEAGYSSPPSIAAQITLAVTPFTSGLRKRGSTGEWSSNHCAF
jgi:isopentenyldiphosphate isomerase